MKKVLLIARAKTDQARQSAERFAGQIANQLADDILVENCEISELFFSVDQAGLAVYHPTKGFDLRDFDLVIIRHIGKYAIEAHAITLYCEHFNIKYTDSYLNRLLLDNKLSTEFALWVEGVRAWPKTFYGPTSELTKRFLELGEKAILKDNEGSKGRLNFVVKSQAEIVSITSEYPETHFLLQEFIPNDSDLRVLVFNYKPVMVIKRSASGASHLNNTSQGGTAEIIPLSDINPRILDLSVRAARASKLEVAGVDVVIDKETRQIYLLEINNAPQISSGSFLEEKSTVYAEMIKDLI